MLRECNDASLSNYEGTVLIDCEGKVLSGCNDAALSNSNGAALSLGTVQFAADSRTGERKKIKVGKRKRKETRIMSVKVNVEEKMGQGVGFERIRRITGYLVGTMDKWNDAKRAEERDRVKHGISHA